MTLLRAALIFTALCSAASASQDPWGDAYQPCDRHIPKPRENGRVDDELIGDMHDKALSWAVIGKRYEGKWRRYVLSGEQGEGAINIYRDAKSYFAFYSGGKSFPICVVSSSADIRLNGAPIVGMSRSEVAKRFGIQKGKEEVLVTDVEGHTSVRLLLSNGVVKTVVFVNTYVD